MAYTLFLKCDSSVIATERQTIMQRSSLVDTLRIVSPKTYNEYNMSEFQLIMEYLTPISKEVRIEVLEAVDTNYKKDFILYKLPITTSITAENGIVQIHFCFIKAEIGEDGTQKNIVREFQTYDLTIVPIESWLTLSDDAVTQLSEQYLAIQKQIKALNALAESLSVNRADDIELDTKSGKIQATANGKKLGNGILIEALNNELVEVGAKTTGNIMIQRI